MDGKEKARRMMGVRSNYCMQHRHIAKRRKRAATGEVGTGRPLRKEEAVVYERSCRALGTNQRFFFFFCYLKELHTNTPTRVISSQAKGEKGNIKRKKKASRREKRNYLLCGTYNTIFRETVYAETDI